MTRRMDRINVLLREEISRIIATEISDPRLPSLVSVTHVEVSPDLRNARVFVSVLGDQEAKRNTLSVLKSASGFIHRTMRGNLTLRSVPFLTFHLDESIEKGAEMLELIKQVQAAERPETEREE